MTRLTIVFALAAKKELRTQDQLAEGVLKEYGYYSVVVCTENAQEIAVEAIVLRETIWALTDTMPLNKKPSTGY